MRETERDTLSSADKVELTGFLADLSTSDRMAPVEATEAAIEQYDLEVRHLNVYYGNFQALRNVNVGIADRKITALIGPSGCCSRAATSTTRVSIP